MKPNEIIAEQLRFATERVRNASLTTEHEDSVLHLALGDLYGVVGNTMRALCSYREIPQRWVPVSERLPTSDGEYLVAIKPILEDEFFVYLSWYEKTNHPGISGWSKSKVSYWMPLPPSPSTRLHEGEK